jgi:hypothetical protein
LKDEGQTGSNRVKRGGNFNNNAQNTRSANRNNNSPDNRNNNLGARLLSTGPVARRGTSTDAPPVRMVQSRSSSGAGTSRTNSAISRRLVGPEGREGGCEIGVS